MSGVVISSGAGSSAAYGGEAMSAEDILLPQMKTTFAPRKRERGKVL